jgi:hypothetical protein
MIRSPLRSPLSSALGSPFAMRRGGGAPAFDPATLFGGTKKGFAYDLVTPALLFQNSNGTGAVSADNDPIGYATDLSGNNNPATQATGTARPLYSAGNGAVGDGTKWMTAGTLDFSGTDKLTVVIAVQNAGTSNQGIFQHGSFNPGDASVIINSASGGKIVGRLAGSTGASEMLNSRSGPGASFKVVSFVFDLAGAAAFDEVKARINGEVYGNTVQAPGPAGGGNFASRVTNIMTWYGGTHLNGKLARILAIGGLLSISELYQVERWAGEPVGLPIISELPPVGLTDYSMMVGYGQSLSLGVSSSPVLSATRRFSNDYMLSGGTEPWAPSPDYASLVPLAEGNKTISASDCGESPLSGMVEMAHEMGFAGATISAVTGFPSLTLAQLSDGQSQYNTNLAVITAAWRRSREQFKHVKVRAVTWMQGEADGGNLTYAAGLNTLLGSLNSSIKAATLQPEDVWLLSYQLARAQIGLAHLAASDTYPRIRVAMPMYHLPTTDTVHLTAASSKIAGAYFGLAYKALILDGNTDWHPLKCTSASRVGLTIDLTYNRSGLVFDTTIVAAQANQGFRVLDAGLTPLTISSVTIVGGNTVRIVVASGTPATVYYGFSSATNHTAGTDKGNLRDSQGGSIVFDPLGLNYPMHNWAVLQSVAL